MNGFAKATAVESLGDGRFGIDIDPDWFGVGPHGGVLAGTMIRALAAHVDDPDRRPLSLTCHFLRPMAAGPGEVRVTTERQGRGVTAVSARMSQGDTIGILALATFGAEREALIDYDSPPPAVPAPEDVENAPISKRRLKIFDRLDYRPCIGASPFSGSASAEVGGWSRLGDHAPIDYPALAMLCDAWPPSSWARLTGPAWAPTIDMTFHFRSRLALRPGVPSPGRRPPANVRETPAPEWVLVRNHSDTSQNGFWEEDSQIWGPDGTLLIQSRQLALLRPIPTP